MQAKHLSHAYIITSLSQNHASNLRLKCSISSIQTSQKSTFQKMFFKIARMVLFFVLGGGNGVCMVAIKTVEFISAFWESFVLPKRDIQSQLQSFLRDCTIIIHDELLQSPVISLQESYGSYNADVRLQMEDCLQQISYKAAAVNLLEKSHCLKKPVLRGPAICFLREDVKRGYRRRYCSILHSLMLCKESLIKKGSALSQSKRRNETWLYSKCCNTLAFCIVFCMR